MDPRCTDTSSVILQHDETSLKLVPPEADPEARIPGKVMYLGGEFRKHRQGSREVRKRRKGSEGLLKSRLPL